MFATLAPSSERSSEAIEQIMARAREQGRGADMLDEEERRAIGLLVASDNQAEGQTEARPRSTSSRTATRRRPSPGGSSTSAG